MGPRPTLRPSKNMGPVQNTGVALKGYESLLKGPLSKAAVGLIGEALVIKYLESQDLKLKSHRLRVSRFSEVDLVFTQDQHEVWVEVKTTQSRKFHFFPWSQKQQEALNRSLEVYSQKNTQTQYQVCLALVSCKQIQFIDQSYLS